MCKDLKTLHPGGIRTRDLLLADAMATVPRRQGIGEKKFAKIERRKGKEERD
jgi:hypothetical protein